MAQETEQRERSQGRMRLSPFTDQDKSYEVGWHFLSRAPSVLKLNILALLAQGHKVTRCGIDVNEEDPDQIMIWVESEPIENEDLRKSVVLAMHALYPALSDSLSN